MNRFFENFWVGWGLIAILGLLLIGTVATGQVANDQSNQFAIGQQELQRANLGSIFPGPLLEPGPHMVWVAVKQNDTALPYSMWRCYGPFEAAAGRSYLVTLQSSGIPVITWKERVARGNNDANPSSLASVSYLNQTSSDKIYGIAVVPALGQVPNAIIADTLTSADPSEPRHPYPHKVHPVFLDEGKTYVLCMSSAEFAPYLMLEDETGALVAASDEDRERLAFQPAKSGRYRLIAAARTSSGEGSYTITVREPLVVMRVDDLLTATDEMRNDCHRKTYDALLTAGRRYYINLESKEFNTGLKLLDPAGMIVAFDEGGMGRNTRIVFSAPATGTYRIVATSAAEHATGAFALTLRGDE